MAQWLSWPHNTPMWLDNYLTKATPSHVLVSGHSIANKRMRAWVDNQDFRTIDSYINYTSNMTHCIAHVTTFAFQVSEMSHYSSMRGKY